MTRFEIKLSQPLFHRNEKVETWTRYPELTTEKPKNWTVKIMYIFVRRFASKSWLDFKCPAHLFWARGRFILTPLKPQRKPGVLGRKMGNRGRNCVLAWYQQSALGRHAWTPVLVARAKRLLESRLLLVTHPNTHCDQCCLTPKMILECLGGYLNVACTSSPSAFQSKLIGDCMSSSSSCCD